MTTVTVNASKIYSIDIGSGLLDYAGAAIRQICGGESLAVVTDETVNTLYGERLISSLTKNGYRASRYAITPGEASKNGMEFLSLLNFLAEEKLTRADIVIALGGGVVGDLAGFAAACYMRGIRFVQMPTTLLAAVDASVGGKTAIDLPTGKNLAGAFYQPHAVICDVDLLSTLTPETYRDGCAEVIKTAVLADKDLFDSLEKPIKEQYETVVARCVEIKRDIVMEDEFETGTRKLLNFGHTVGHAIEWLSQYKITHGSAVAAGMAIITRAACGMGVCSAACTAALLRVLQYYGLPASTTYDAADLTRACLLDKKRVGEHLTLVLPKEIGCCVLHDINISELEGIIDMGLKERRD
jgi:3-dehydroquinate synthase